MPSESMYEEGREKQKKKKQASGRTPAHNNSFAFRHNPKSKLTAKILNSPNEGLCRRCYEKVEWRKKYRKYKPLSQPAKCNQCHGRTVLAAYHSFCTSCAQSRGGCAGCGMPGGTIGGVVGKDNQGILLIKEIESKAKDERIPLREKQRLLRAIDNRKSPSGPSGPSVIG